MSQKSAAVVSVEDWVAAEKVRLDRFTLDWTRNADTDPQHWPLDLEPGEWDEQYRLFENDLA